jgi:hypothetical protein
MSALPMCDDVEDHQSLSPQWQVACR